MLPYFIGIIVVAAIAFALFKGNSKFWGDSPDMPKGPPPYTKDPNK